MQIDDVSVHFFALFTQMDYLNRLFFVHPGEYR